jgi:hypothetical protein
MVGDFLPSNMTEASLPEPVFMKNCFSVPSLSLVVIFDVDAKLDPPPALDIIVSLRSKDKSLAIAESIVMSLILVAIAEILLMTKSIKSTELKQRDIAIKVCWACFNDVQLDYRKGTTCCQHERHTGVCQSRISGGSSRSILIPRSLLIILVISKSTCDYFR